MKAVTVFLDAQKIGDYCKLCKNCANVLTFGTDEPPPKVELAR
jgi:hypothetical protein